MAEQYWKLSKVRSYEVSIWSLLDRFISILKWANMDNKGLVQDPEVVLRDDGTQEFSFTIPLFYQDGFNRIPNPLWVHLNLLPLEANMHKLKIVFNKNTENEAVFEFLVVSVTEDHAQDEVDITVKAEGLAFHELGKTGYRINLSQENFEVIENNWFDNGYNFETGLWAPRPLMNILFWNDLIFKDSDGDWRTNWTYEIRMDWSAFSNSEINRYSDVLYEDAYVSSWQLDGKEIKPRAVENLREKERPIEIKESNYYNVTQTIAELFGVFCKYEYEHNERYEIIGRKVVYYNNYIKDTEGHIDLTYPYSSLSITRTSDNTSLTTKLYVHTVEDEEYGDLSIMNVEANRSREDYLLNFDYLTKIGAINEELIADLKLFETDIRFINDILMQNQERTRIVQNLLIDVSANVTFYDNAMKLDTELYTLAENLKNAIAGESGKVPIEKMFTVMDGTDKGYGWYINITVEGLDNGSISLYESRETSTGLNGVGYKNPILFFTPIFDEYGNIIRLLNLSRNEDLIDNSQVYLVGMYDPHSKYQKIMDTWELRLAIDTKNYEKARDEETTLNWYLHGSRVGYAIVEGSKLDGEYCGLGLVWDDAFGPAPDLNDRNYNLYITYTLDARILSNSAAVDELKSLVEDGDISKITFDYFFDEDAENSTPDLLYYFEIYTKLKEKTVNAFERMMGPALREGYWQPEDYNDYGDVYYDSFIIGNEPKTPYLHFLWDHSKYYEGEEGIIYQANTAGDMRLHLVINLTNYLPLIKDHLNNLVFGYLDPVLYATLKELEKTIITAKNKLLNKIPASTDKVTYTIFDATYISASKFKTYYNLHPLSVGIFNSILEEHANLEDWNPTELELITDLYESIIETDIAMITNSEIEYTISNLDSMINTISRINKSLDTLKSYCASWITAEKEILKKIPNPADYGKHSISDKTNANYPGHLQMLTAEQEKITNLYTLSNKVLSWYLYVNSIKKLIASISSNKENAYRTFMIGADCELGWVIDKNDENQKAIPVLIVTGTDTLSTQILEFILTGIFTYNSGIPDEGNNPSIDEIYVSAEDAAFIGYYDSEIEGLSGNIAIEKIFTLNLSLVDANKYITDNGDFIGNAMLDTITINDSGEDRPVEIKEYRFQRVYPRLYFSSLKLRDSSTKLRLKLNLLELVVNEHYYIVLDDRSKGLKVDGIGYYLTLRSSLLYSCLCLNIPMSMDVLYTLLNADTSIYLDAILVSKENAFPKVSYDVQLSILNPEFISTAYNRLNQIVHINDNDLKLEEVSGYISSVTLKLDKPWEDTVEVKNYLTKFEDLFSTIVALTEAMKKGEGGISNAVKAFNANGFIDSDVLQDSMLKANLNLQFNQGTLTISQRDGIWGESKSGVVAFRGGGIFTATTKDANGNWNWNTGILPAGINADLITSGQLDTNRIKIYAGNELRFLMNGSGLYAYKGFSEEERDLLVGTINASSEDDKTQQINAINELINASSKKLYLLYNSEGLFLRAEAGAYVLQNKLLYADENNTVPLFETKTYINSQNREVTYLVLDPVTGEKILKTKPTYNLVENQVDRVEVSWEGLILRNWMGEKVFYADPDTGNLTLKGYVEANGGQIGGWTLYNDRLTSNGISLISGPPEAAGILLSPTGLRLNTVTDYVNDRILYKYNPVDSNDEANVNVEYFLDFDSMYDLQVSGAYPIVYEVEMRISSAIPKYIENTESYELGEETINNSESGGDANTAYNLTLSGEVTSAVSNVYYIKETENALNIIKDSSGNPIIYNPNADNLDWFNTIVDLYTAQNKDYTSFIDIVYVETYIPHNYSGTLVLRPAGSNEVTFKVSAASGEVTILSGTLGNMTIVRDEGLSGGTISKAEFKEDNTFLIGNKTHTFGELFYNFEIDENSGEIKLYRVNGRDTVNFNIAATAFYKNAIAAAGKLSLTVNVNGTNYTVTAETEKKTKTYSGNAGSGGATIKATASTGIATLEKSAVIDALGSASAGEGTSESGICVDCKSTCFLSCAKVCQGLTEPNASSSTLTCSVNCIGHCKATCSGSCSTACAAGCSSGCGSGCSTGCSGSCGTVCSSGCGAGCSPGCGNNCGTSCSIKCKGTTRPSTGGGCFAPGTLITLCDDKRRPIEKIRKGDLVVAYNVDTKEFENKIISHVHQHENTPKLILVIFDDGTDIIMTPGHPILSIEGWKSRDIENSREEHMTEATLLNIGDVIIGANNNKIVIDIKEYDNTNNIIVYNATTEDDHTFIANDIIVHNAKDLLEIM